MSKFIVANWKLHPVTAQEAETLFKSVLGGVKGLKTLMSRFARRRFFCLF